MPLRSRRDRRQAPGHWRLKKPVWIDPYPFIPGTHPEKQVFAALRAANIYFRFQDDFPIRDKAISVLLQQRQFQPDFLLPQYKVIFDPFGDFHHSLPDAVLSDAYKEMYYLGAGYEFVHPWSSDVDKFGGSWVLGLSQRLRHGPLYPLPKEDAPFFSQGYKLGPDLGAGTKGVAIANSHRKKPKPIGLTRRTGRGRRS